MTEPAPSAGVHLPWAQVPEHVQAWAAGLGRGSVDRVSDLEGGFSPGATSRLHFSDGADVFVKAVGLDLNPESPTLHRREGVVASVLPSLPFLPRFIDAYDDGDWVALAFEAIDGQLPRRPWEQAELSAAIDALVSMHDALDTFPVVGDPSSR